MILSALTRIISDNQIHKHTTNQVQRSMVGTPKDGNGMSTDGARSHNDTTIGSDPIKSGIAAADASAPAKYGDKNSGTDHRKEVLVALVIAELQQYYPYPIANEAVSTLTEFLV
jgi:hypothetical protein